MTDDTSNAIAEQSAEVAASAAPLASPTDVAAPGIPVTTASAAPAAAASSIPLTNDAEAVKHDLERDTRSELRKVIDLGLSELRAMGAYTEKELAHLTAIFTKHI